MLRWVPDSLTNQDKPFSSSLSPAFSDRYASASARPSVPDRASLIHSASPSIPGASLVPMVSQVASPCSFSSRMASLNLSASGASFANSLA